MQIAKQALNNFYEKMMAPKPDGTRSSAYLYKRLFKYFKPYLFRTILTLFITIPIGALDGAVAYSLKPYIDAMQVEKSVANVSFVPFIIVGFTLLQGLLNYTSIYLNGWLGVRIMADLQRELFHKLQTLDVAFFDISTSGEVIQRYFQDPQSINISILKNTKQILTRLFSSLALMSVLIGISWKLSVIAISVLLLVLFPSTQIRKIIKSISRETTAAMGNVLSFYTETVGGIRVIYGYNLPKYRLKKYDVYQRNLITMSVKATQAQGWLTPSMHVIASIGIALIIWQGSSMVVSKELTTGAFISFITAMLMLYNPIKNLGGSLVTAQMSMLAANRIFTLLDQMPAIVDKPNAKMLDGIREGIRFEAVNFHYVSDKPILRDLNLNFKKGETIAIVGSSGSGKTTIANLLPRFYEVQKGKILIDGINIRDYTLDSLRQNIALVMQDNFLFNGSLRDNLLMGNPAATDQEILDALEQAHLKSYADALPDGLDTAIGERGVMLSGGQRQRVAIARAILKNAPIVILDEATSALDSKSESIVQKAMDALMADRTVLVIAHRLSTIRNADRIIVLEDGIVVEEGTHDHLMSANRVYAALYRTQFREHSKNVSEDMASQVGLAPAVAL